jgi:hypothetical protein
MQPLRIENARAAWTVYESNVQQYRSLSVTVQSFFLTVGSLVATSSRDGFSAVVVMGIVTSIGLVHLLYIWHLPLRARHKVVDYYKFQIECDLTAEQISALEALCSVDRYVNDAAMRAKVNRDVFKKPNMRVFRTTRMKFDIVVPCLYALVWAALLTWTLHTHL